MLKYLNSNVNSLNSNVKISLTKFLYVLKIHSSIFPIENRICSCYIPSLQGRSKEMRYITVNGRYLFKVNFSNVKISLT